MWFSKTRNFQKHAIFNKHVILKTRDFLYKKDRSQEILSFVKMLCLHGKPAVTSTTENGFTFWFCGEPSGCFICSEEEAPLYDQGIKAFLSVNQERPKCCTITCDAVGERCYAKFRVLTGKEKHRWWSGGKKENVGRPLFTCGNRHRWDSRGCGYVEWGDRHIIPRPTCKHGFEWVREDTTGEKKKDKEEC